jgi:hypothetical protein
LLQSSVCVAVGAIALGCGGTPSAPAEDEVYYLHERGAIDRRYTWERYYPSLDHEETRRLPKRVGVAVFEGDVVLSRPIDWFLRTADYTPERRVISYQSPRQFQFNIYERVDPPGETWDAILDRYEEDVKNSGSEILSARIPVATANAQGRSYLVKTVVDKKPTATDTLAHEILVRTPNRILLVQIVHGDNIDTSIDEMTAALRSIIVY